MEEEQGNELEGKTLKEGSRIVGPTRRPDGTLRKPIRIRPGYTPPDEVQIYQSKGAIWKKEIAALQEAPPGYEPKVVAKPKTKAAKRNERKKEKRHQQASLEKGEHIGDDCASSADGLEGAPDHVESVASQMTVLSISATSSTNNPPLNSMENGISEDQGQDIDKKIRALKKKIRLTEAQQQKTTKKDMEPEQLEKLAKLEGWRHELNLLEEKRAEIVQTP
ncbi:hypothetical protein LIER_27226 [Lithospermum erythrorhizon]|uniref:WIBG Mago-binding domain-containing protein n=1 Tax=Lithospermum erythrorhizon TaxID=34254 RepID=A0AAV3REB5_LITER